MQMIDSLLNKEPNWEIIFRNASISLAVFFMLTAVCSYTDDQPIFINKKENNYHEES